MSLTKAKEAAIVKDIRRKKYSYACIARYHHVSVEEVRRLAQPLQKEWWEKEKARRALNKITNEAEYDRAEPECFNHGVTTEKYPASVTFIGLIILLCILGVIIAAAIGLIKLFLGL